jgi:hypothetical protein
MSDERTMSGGGAPTLADILAELRAVDTRLGAKIDDVRAVIGTNREERLEQFREMAGHVLRSEERVRDELRSGLAGIRDDIANARSDARTDLVHEVGLLRARLAALERKVYGEGASQPDERV